MNKLKKEWDKWFLFFMVYCLIGWIYEVSLELFVFHAGFVNRGFLWGPYLPVYGFGGMLMVISMRKLKNKENLPALVRFIGCFVGVVLLTTVVELIASYLMEATTGGWLWDYTEYSFNFQGRIALNTSLRFGVIGIVVLYVIQPLMEKLVEKLRHYKIYYIVVYIILACFVIDIAFRFVFGSNFVQS